MGWGNLRSIKSDRSKNRMCDEVIDLPNWFNEVVVKHTNNAPPAEIVDECADRRRSFVLNVKEWDDEASRQLDGFRGTDFCHGSTAPVRILKYLLHYDEGDPHARIVAPVVFTPRAESGRGYCHGGSMCAVMDDAIGWMGFSFTGEVRPWMGYTVQVNTTLKKSIPVGSVLRLDASVERLEGQRKVWIKASLADPADPSIVYCTGQGLFLRPTSAISPASSSSTGSTPHPPSLISPSTSTVELSSVNSL